MCAHTDQTNKNRSGAVVGCVWPSHQLGACTSAGCSSQAWQFQDPNSPAGRQNSADVMLTTLVAVVVGW